MQFRAAAWAVLLWSASAFAADVVGTWNLTVTTSAGTGTPTLVLAQDGEKLTGVYTGRFGTSPITGTIKGDVIEFHFTVTGPMGSGEVSYSGTVTGSQMSGDMKMGQMGGGTFTGKRP